MLQPFNAVLLRKALGIAWADREYEFDRRQNGRNRKRIDQGSEGSSRLAHSSFSATRTAKKVELNIPRPERKMSSNVRDGG